LPETVLVAWDASGDLLWPRIRQTEPDLILNALGIRVVVARRKTVAVRADQTARHILVHRDRRNAGQVEIGKANLVARRQKEADDGPHFQPVARQETLRR
jgi:hypothetical protein